MVFWLIYLCLLSFHCAFGEVEVTVENVLDGGQSDLIVHTTSGPIEGVVVKSFTNKDVTAYFGIPYAEPPVGDLRFKPPVPVKPWTHTFKANTKPLPCYQQYSKTQLESARKSKTLIPRPWSEDCLKLNVWTPRPIPDDKDLPIAIIVFIHGGSFLTGSGHYPYADGSTVAAEANLYTVSLNYRLGAFGFLNLGHPDAAGNMGLLDQQLALKWIKENAPHFGGNTGGLVIWGVGAGSASVGYQVISKGSKDLFRTAILRSGAPTCPWAFHSKDDSEKKARSFADKIGCKSDDVSDKIECLRKIHPEDIIDVERSDHEQFKPTVDGVFIDEPPTDAMQKGNFNNVSIFSSNMFHDGSLNLLAYNTEFMSSVTEGLTLDNFRTAVGRLVPHLSHTQLRVVQNFYLGNCSSSKLMLQAAIDLYTDYLVACCMNEFTELASRGGGFTYRSVYDERLASLPTWMGATHGTDQVFIFGYPLLGEKAGFTPQEAATSFQFIREVGPLTRQKVGTLKKWLDITNVEKKPYTKWTSMVPTFLDSYRDQECKLWNNVLPELDKGRLHCAHNRK